MIRVRGLGLALLLLPAAGWTATAAEPDASRVASESAAVTHAGTSMPDGLYARFETVHGAIVVELFPDDAPLAVANFVGLAEGTIPFEGRPAGQPFFDGLAFHRVVGGFVVQGGDPLGTGEGGPGYTFPDEFTPRRKHDTAGTLAMANEGPNTNGSQFYLTLSAVNRLNYKHTVFGRVVRGLDVLVLVRQGDVMNRVAIIRSGDAAEAFRPDAASFSSLLGRASRIAPRHAALPPLFVDEADLEFPDFFPVWINEKLHHYAELRGVTIYVRTLPRLEAAGDEAAESAALADLHERLAQRDPRSATLVYTAEERRWRVWLGDGLFDLLGATPDRMADVKARILAEAVAQVESGSMRRAVDAATTDLIEALDQAEFPSR